MLRFSRVPPLGADGSGPHEALPGQRGRAKCGADPGLIASSEVLPCPGRCQADIQAGGLSSQPFGPASSTIWWGSSGRPGGQASLGGPRDGRHRWWGVPRSRSQKGRDPGDSNRGAAVSSAPSLSIWRCAQGRCQKHLGTLPPFLTGGGIEGVYFLCFLRLYCSLNEQMTHSSKASHGFSAQAPTFPA